MQPQFYDFSLTYTAYITLPHAKLGISNGKYPEVISFNSLASVKLCGKMQHKSPYVYFKFHFSHFSKRPHI